MAIDKSKYEQIEVAGEGIMPVLKGISVEALCKAMLNRHGLDNVKIGSFYPLNNYLALLEEVEERMPSVFKIIGILMKDHLNLPPGLGSFEQLLSVTNQVYYLQHRGCKQGEIGYYQFEKISDSEFLLTLNGVPYSCGFQSSIFQGYAEKFGQQIDFEHIGEKCRSKGDSECRYRIRLRE